MAWPADTGAGRVAPRSPAPTATTSPIWSNDGSRPAPRTWRGAKTSPTSPPGRAGCTWPRCSTSAPGDCWATRWPTTCAPSSSSTRSPWPWAPEAETTPWPASSPTPTGAANTPATTTSTSATTGRCARRQAPRRCAGTTRWPSRSGRASSESASKTASSPPGPRPAGRSSAGSTGTRPPGFTAPSTTSHRSTGNSSTVKRHNHPSGRRGEAQVDLGEHRLKGLARPERLYRLDAHVLPSVDLPLRVGRERAGNLPHVRTPLLARGQQLEDLAQLLRDRWLVTITGPGGVGKTRLAVAAAHACADRFVDGTWLVELDELVAPGDVVAAVTTTMRLQPGAGRDPAVAAAAALAGPRAFLGV